MYKRQIYIDRAVSKNILWVDNRSPLIIGVDPATSHGPSASTIVYRAGPKADNIQRYQNIEPEQLAELLYEQAINSRASAVVIDRTEGVGDHVYTWLRTRLGPNVKVLGVIFSQRPIRKDLYANARAELYGGALNWIRASVDIPDDPLFIKELKTIKRKSQSDTKLQLIPKSEMLKEGLASPDSADAFALTFYVPAQSPEHFINRPKFAARSPAFTHGKSSRPSFASNYSRPNINR